MENQSHKSVSDLSVTEFLNCFSVPVVVGSAVSAFFWSTYFQTSLPLIFYWLLPSTVWLIYTIDHILDGRRLGSDASSLRHRIHFIYRKELQFTCLILILLNTILSVTSLPTSILLTGGSLALLISVYFVFVHRKSRENSVQRKIPSKEIFIAIGACIGMLVLPGIPATAEWSLGNVLLILSFFGINFGNILIFSFFDHDDDLKDGFSTAGSIGVEKLEQLIQQVLISTFLLITFWTFVVNSPRKLPVIMTLMLMLNMLGLIMIKKEEFKDHGRYRLWGDMIYLAPGLIWFLLRNTDLF